MNETLCELATHTNARTISEILMFANSHCNARTSIRAAAWHLFFNGIESNGEAFAFARRDIMSGAIFARLSKYTAIACKIPLVFTLGKER